METKQLMSSINRIGAAKLTKWILQESITGYPPSTQASILGGALAAAKAAGDRDDDADVAIPQVAADAARQVKELHDEVDDARLYAAYHLLIAAASAAHLKGEA